MTEDQLVFCIAGTSLVGTFARAPLMRLVISAAPAVPTGTLCRRPLPSPLSQPANASARNGSVHPGRDGIGASSAEEVGKHAWLQLFTAVRHSLQTEGAVLAEMPDANVAPVQGMGNAQLPLLPMCATQRQALEPRVAGEHSNDMAAKSSGGEDIIDLCNSSSSDDDATQANLRGGARVTTRVCLEAPYPQWLLRWSLHLLQTMWSHHVQLYLLLVQ